MEYLYISLLYLLVVLAVFFTFQRVRVFGVRVFLKNCSATLIGFGVGFVMTWLAPWIMRTLLSPEEYVPLLLTSWRYPWEILNPASFLNISASGLFGFHAARDGREIPWEFLFFTSRFVVPLANGVIYGLYAFALLKLLGSVKRRHSAPR